MDNLYLIRSFGKDGQSYIKLGYSSNIDQRLDIYKSHNPFIEIIKTFYRKDAKIFENNFHINNKSSYKNEWYDEGKLEYILYCIKNENIKYASKKNDKKCSKCKIVKSLTEFNKSKSRKDGFHNVCKSCRKKYRQINKKNISEYNKMYRNKKKG